MRMLVALAVGTLVIGRCCAQASGSWLAVELHPGDVKLTASAITKLLDEAKAAAEIGRVVIEKMWRKPAAKQTLHLWLDPKEYAAVGKQPHWSFVPDAVARPEQKEAHVLVRPVLDEATFARVGLSPNVRAALIEQAAVLAAADRSELAREDRWCAGLFAAGVVEAAMFADVADGVDPNRDSRWWQIVEWEREGEMNLHRCYPVDFIPVDAEGLDTERQCQAALAHYLATTGKGWARKLLSEQARTVDQLAQNRVNVVQGIVGRDWRKNDEAFRKLWQTKAVRWRVGSQMVAVKDGRLVLAANADAWATVLAVAEPPKSTYAITGTVEIPEGSKAAATVMLDWRLDGSYVACSFEPGHVRFEFVGAKQNDERVVDAPIRRGKPCKFAIELADKVVVSIDGAKVGEYPVVSAWQESWGLATLGGSVVFADVKCEVVK